jgi:hypothetical protein
MATKIDHGGNRKAFPQTNNRLKHNTLFQKAFKNFPENAETISAW